MSRPSNKPARPRHRARAREGDPLTARELEILSLVAAGEPTPAISQQLGVSGVTIKTHLTSVYRKTGCRNRVQAARYYLDNLAAAPPVESVPAPSRAGDGDASLIERQIEEIQARLDELAGAVAEAERLRVALAALRSIQRG